MIRMTLWSYTTLTDSARKDGVETKQDCHREDDISILSSNEEIAKYVVGDTPDEPRDPV